MISKAITRYRGYTVRNTA